MSLVLVWCVCLVNLMSVWCVLRSLLMRMVVRIEVLIEWFMVLVIEMCSVLCFIVKLKVLSVILFVGFSYVVSVNCLVL